MPRSKNSNGKVLRPVAMAVINSTIQILNLCPRSVTLIFFRARLPPTLWHKYRVPFACPEKREQMENGLIMPRIELRLRTADDHQFDFQTKLLIFVDITLQGELYYSLQE